MNGKCPVCGKPLTVGVCSRVDDLADREDGVKPKNAAPFENLVPLAEIIAMVYETTAATKKVEEKYNELILAFGNEFAVLHAGKEDLSKITVPQIVDGILRVRERNIYIAPGFDGEFGVVSLEKPKNADKLEFHGKQKTLEEY